MNLLAFNNKKVKVTDIDGVIFKGIALYQAADDYDEEQDSLAIKTGYSWTRLLESEISSVEVI